MAILISLLMWLGVGGNLFGAAQSPLFPSQGGTGTSTKPTYGKMLVGNAAGTYTLTATSSLGITGGGSGTPGGSDTQIQFNDGDSFGATADMIWDAGTKSIVLNGDFEFFGLPTDATPGVRVRDQSVVDTQGKDLDYRSGKGNGAGGGGAVDIIGGDGGAGGGVSAHGGHVYLDAGYGGSTGGDGGSIFFNSGSAQGGDFAGGDIIYTPGSGSGSGLDGVVKFRDPASARYITFDTSLIADTDKTFTFPNESGTFCITALLTSCGVGTSTPSSLFSVGYVGTATTTIFLSSAPTKGTCIVMKDVDGTGLTYLTANNGVLTVSTDPCNL